MNATAAPTADAARAALWVRLRAEGAQRLDPVRFHYLEQLAQRLSTTQDAVRELLQPRFDAALDDYGARWSEAQQGAKDEVAALTVLHPARVRELRRLFAQGDYRGMRRAAARAAREAGAGPLTLPGAREGRRPDGAGEGAQPEMHSVQRFRDTWSRLAAQEAVDFAAGRAPANAGPLNAQALALHSLASMRELSPDYLWRFLSHAQTLMWLEQAVQRHASNDAAPARGARARTKTRK